MVLTVAQIQKSIDFRNLIETADINNIVLKICNQYLYSQDGIKTFKEIGFLRNTDYLKILCGKMEFVSSVVYGCGAEVAHNMFANINTSDELPQNPIIIDCEEFLADINFRQSVFNTPQHLLKIDDEGIYDFGDEFVEYTTYGGLSIFDYIKNKIHIK
jgi:hypothetical protein